MQRISFGADGAVDEAFVNAVVAVTGLPRMHVADTYWGADRETGSMRDEPMPDADVYLEWTRHEGRFGLWVELYGHGRLREPMSVMAFVRAMAMRLGRSLLTSDCGANPWSYFLVKPDGAIARVSTLTDEPDGTAVFDLACDLSESDPSYHAELEVWPAEEALPRKPEDAPDEMPREIGRFCHPALKAENNLCEVVWGACPYSRIDWDAR